MKEAQPGDEPELAQASHGLGYYLRQPIILVTAFAFFCYNYILFFFLSWFPAYLVQAHGLDIKSMSMTTVIPWIVGFVGPRWAAGSPIRFSTSLAAAAVAKNCAGGRVTGRRPCVALAGTVEGVTSAVLLMSISIFFLYITGAIYWAIIQDVVHKSRVGGISGFIHLVGSVSGIIGPIVTGFIVQHTGKFDSAFVLAA